MNRRTTRLCVLPLMAGSFILGPSAAAWATAPTAPAAPAAASCLAQGNPADATKVKITGEGYKPGLKVILDQTDGAGAGSAIAGPDGKFASGDVPAGKWQAFQQAEGGASATCLGGQEATDAATKKLVDQERARGAKEGFAAGAQAARDNNCDSAPPQKNNRNLTAKQEAQLAFDKAFETAFRAAIDKFC
ncbi:hypothetical protein AMK16_24225 [Streptomyces sp. CB00455]|uniref:hypothetical protein n=1 Tax=Streptomyces sp. CB00455 TaxID=1703927 RepID=UPI00093EC55B|nr:hypothetical protein [Streptomyces sp. CB00455]OKK16809.1 hypothetical protein AMK16_24225 [Streptomyces sp. CB00455]